MIRVTFELVSAKHPRRSRVLGVMHITNTGTGTKARGNYVVAVLDRHGRPYRSAVVLDYPRKAMGAWHLLARALHALGFTGKEGK